MRNPPETSPAAQRLLAQLSTGLPARDICGRLTDELDERVVESFTRHLGDDLLLIAAFAVGGYGRRETFPHADIDLLIVYAGVDDERPPEVRLDEAIPGAAERVKKLIIELRDSGLRLSARVRSLAEHERLIGEDVTIATASLDARHVVGSLAVIPDPTAHARSTIAARFGGGVDRFCALILEGLQHRHRQFGGSSFMLEPQLKSGRGGLRDAHAVRWAGRLLYGTDDLIELGRQRHMTETDAEELARAYDFVSRARLALHALGRWRNDRLAFELQPAVARAMGFSLDDEKSSVEAFMKAFYRHANALASLAERVLRTWTQPGQQQVEPLGEGFGLRGGRLWWETPGSPTIENVALVLFRMATAGVALDDETAAWVREALAACEARTPITTAAVGILRHGLLEADGDRVIATLVELNVLGRLIPEWAHIEGHTSHDVYHVYTTDRHLMAVYRLVSGLLSGTAPAPGCVSEALARIRAVDEGDFALRALRISSLLHDVGKGMDGDHSLIGAGMAAEVARRIDEPIEVREMARWLVLEHLRMARTSQRRDLNDPVTIQAFVDGVPDVLSLDLLVILTWADMMSVAPNFTSSGWKVDLLAALYERARAEMLGETYTAPRLPERAPIAKLLEDGLLDDADVAWLATELPHEQWAMIHDAQLAEVATTLLAMRGGARDSVAFELAESGDRARILIAARDRRGLLAALTAAVASERLSILRARIFTTKAGFALDELEVDWLDPGGRPWPDARKRRVLATLESALIGEVSLDELRRRRQSESRIARPARPPVPTQVVVFPFEHDNARAVVEVKCRDRVGLLADISTHLAAIGYDIERSIIAIEGDRAIDTFYVRRTLDDGPETLALPTLLRDRLDEDDSAG